ncbi:Uncharacterised protein [Mycobacteroides abscessus subsp. abscessus]|nr:Uncharacterised protein [Mycobacteroides abscessus subsp. abscessus]SKW36735.1 Uncharacterised protein [Mycobacteroides abscessus subsp. abscessus]
MLFAVPRGTPEFLPSPPCGAACTLGRTWMPCDFNMSSRPEEYPPLPVHGLSVNSHRTVRIGLLTNVLYPAWRIPSAMPVPGTVVESDAC